MKSALAIGLSILICVPLMGMAVPVDPPGSEAETRQAVTDSSAVVVDHGLFEAGSVVIIRGDRVAELKAEDERTGLVGCDYRNAAFVNVSGWQESLDGCGIIGFDWTARYSYLWSRDTLAWNSGPSCVQGRGYSTNRTVSTPVWTNAGCGSSGSVSAFIGNRATVAKIRGHVNAAGKIGYVRWR